MSLSNYNSFYEIFAGLAAALAGVEFITTYLIEKIEEKYTQLKRSFDIASRKYQVDLRFFEEIKDNPDISPNFKKWINIIYRLHYSSFEWCVTSNNKFKIKNELNIIQNKAPRISIFVFLYTLSVIVIIGLGQDKIVLDPISMIGTLTLISFLMMYRMSFFICRNENYKMRYSIFSYLFGLSITIFHYLFIARPKHWLVIQAPETFVLISSLAFCLYAFFLMLSRSLVWLVIKHPAYRIVLSYLIKNQARNRMEDRA